MIQEKDPFFKEEYIVELCELIKEEEHPDLVSTLGHDMTGFPPIRLLYGENEIFLGFTEQFISETEKYGVKLDIVTVKNAPHCFPLFLFTPEGKTGLNKIAEYIAE